MTVCAFTAEHNIALSSFDHLTSLLKHLFNDSDTAKNISLNSTGKIGFQNLVAILKNQCFSIIIDESTNIDSKKNLVVVARYVVNLTVCESFLTLMEVPEANAKTLFKNLLIFLIVTIYRMKRIWWSLLLTGQVSWLADIIRFLDC